MSAAGPQADIADAPRRGKALLLLPLVVFVLLSGLFLLQLLSGRDASDVPSALIGAPAPSTPLPPLEGSGLPGLDPQTFRDQVTLVNVWASWCGPCRQEHPLLVELSRDPGLRIVGINQKDVAANALAFLNELGNPFDAVGVDANGRASIEWGVYGVPETFLVGPDGKILFKHVGPLSPEALREKLLPAIEQARTQRPPA
ncbi:MAG TPA: DsbE family thiol:disulfide interchange protein [Mesorhizobium sp.]|jgi:cytochrome c biogenesis protein CcmG/thiol:disulfide interchange protein DsbE|nr:DsbE family thiol:disulfide interchange protein [Mesorhizobium sp.]